jgi:hypothetical protein
MYSHARAAAHVEDKAVSAAACRMFCQLLEFSLPVRLYLPKPPNGPPNPPPPMPPPKNCLNSSSGLISSSNMDPPPPLGARCDANPEKGEAPEADAPEKRDSGSPPNLSYFDFLSGSDNTWKARETSWRLSASIHSSDETVLAASCHILLKASSAPAYPFLSGCVNRLSFL